MSCKVATGLEGGCDLGVGGLDGTFWAGYTSELNTPISTAQLANLADIDFTSTGYLRRFSGAKYAHSMGCDLVVESKRRKYFTYSLVIKLISTTVASDVTIQRLLGRKDIFFIVQDNNRRFFLLGANGMRPVGGDQNTGQTIEADVSDQLTFMGIEKTKPLRFGVGDYQSILDQIEDYEDTERNVIVQETGFAILQETGDTILRE